MKLPKRWKWIAALLVIVALIAVLLRPSTVPIETGTVTRDTLSTVISEVAQTRARDRYVVAVPVAGRVTRTRVRPGDLVQRGTILATVLPAMIDARVATSAQADVRAAEARVAPLQSALAEAEQASAQAGRDLDRTRVLYDGGAVSKSQLEGAQLAAQAAQTQREQARGALAVAEANVDAARAALIGDGGGSRAGVNGTGETSADATRAKPVDIVAPTSGTVLQVLQESARVAQAGSPLVEIADTGGMEVVIELLTEQAVQVRSGDPIRFTGWGGDRVLAGTVRLIEPAAFTKVSALGVEEQRVNVIGDIAERNPGLGTGFRLQAAIVTWTGTGVLTVPTTALFRRSGAWKVFVNDGGRARLAEVKIGHRGVERAEVLSGLSEGARVILFPSDLIDDGVRVKDATRDKNGNN